MSRPWGRVGRGRPPGPTTARSHTRRSWGRGVIPIVVLGLLAGCQVRTVATEPDADRVVGFADVEPLGGGAFATWACAEGLDGVHGAGITVHGRESAASGGCDSPGHMASTPETLFLLTSQVLPDGDLGILVVRVSLFWGSTAVVFHTVVPRTPSYPDAGEIDVSPQGTIVVGLPEAETGVTMLHRVTGLQSSVPIPGTEGMGQAGFQHDPAGGWIGIAGDQVVRVGLLGRRTVLAGTGEPGFSGDGGPAVDAHFDGPTDLALTPTGRLLVADSGNDRVRTVVPGGIVTTAVGGGTSEEEGAAPGDTLVRGLTAVASDADDGCFWYADAVPRGDDLAGRVRFVGGTGCPGHPDHPA